MEKTAQEVDILIDEGQTAYSIRDFHDTDPSLKKQFEFTMTHLQMNEVRLLFVLAPYHPIVYDAISRDPSYARVTRN